MSDLSHLTPTAPGDTPAAVVGDIEQFLHDLLAQMPPDAQEAKPGRPRILPALALWGGLLVCVLHGFDHLTALWRLLAQRGLWFYPRFPVSDQAVYTRLASGGLAPLAHLLNQVRAVLTARLAPYADMRLAPFATEVVALDETTLDAVARRLPALRGVPPGDARLLPGKLAAGFDLRRQLWRQVRHQPDPHQNEKVLARTLVDDLPAGTLVVADLGYFGFAWFDDLTTAGLHWLSRLRTKTSYTVIHPFYQHADTLDALVWLGAHRADRARYAVRRVQFRTRRGLHRYLTNVTDPHLFPPTMIAQVYARRWDIELAFDLVKTHLGLHLLWASHPLLVLQQVWAVLIISQILQALRLEIAGRAGVDPFEVSLPLLVEYLPRWLAEGRDPVAELVATGRRFGFIRPSTRTRIDAPHVPRDQLISPPAGLVCERSPRYAGRRCATPVPCAPVYTDD
jgi:hypothetical protein